MEFIIKELKEGNLVVLAGGPQSGIDLAAEILVYKQKGVAIFNFEMSKEWCTKRLLCSDAFTDKDGLVIENLYIDDTPAISVEEIKEKCVRLKEEKDLGLIVIDYFQLLESKTVDDAIEPYKAIRSSLKAIAKELDVCVLLIAQLSKIPKANKPKLEDFISSKYLVDNADSIFFLDKDSHNSIEILKRSNNE